MVLSGQKTVHAVFLRNEKINLKVIIISFLCPGKKMLVQKRLKWPNFNYYNRTYYDLIEKTEIFYLSFALLGFSTRRINKSVISFLVVRQRFIYIPYLVSRFKVRYRSAQ